MFVCLKEVVLHIMRLVPKSRELAQLHFHAHSVDDKNIKKKNMNSFETKLPHYSICQIYYASPLPIPRIYRLVYILACFCN